MIFTVTMFFVLSLTINKCINMINDEMISHRRCPHAWCSQMTTPWLVHPGTTTCTFRIWFNACWLICLFFIVLSFGYNFSLLTPLPLPQVLLLHTLRQAARHTDGSRWRRQSNVLVRWPTVHRVLGFHRQGRGARWWRHELSCKSIRTKRWLALSLVLS